MKVGRRILFAILVVMATAAIPVAAHADGGSTNGNCHIGLFCGG